MTTRTYTRLKIFRLWLAFILILGVTFAALGEGLARLRAWIKYGDIASIEDILHVDPAIDLRVPIANSSIVLARRSKITINSSGFRSPELESPKPAGTIRLAFLGGSTTFSPEVTATEKNWPHLITETLRRQFPGTKFDYLNAGVPGHRIESSLKNLEHRVKPLLPDIIIIYHANNDLAVDVRELALAQGLVGSDAKEAGWLSEVSFLWQLFEKNIAWTMRQNEGRSSHKKLKFDPYQSAQKFKAGLTRLVKAGQEAASIVIIATFSTKARREQPREQRLANQANHFWYMPYMSSDSLLEGFAAYNRVIGEVAAETGAVLVGDEMTIPGDAIHFDDSIHFTDRGSIKMAERVSRVLAAHPALKKLVESRTDPKA